MTVCSFSSYACSTEDYAAALGFLTDASWTATALLAAGERIFDLERQYNADCGIGAESDVLPERFLKEPVPTGPHAGKVCDLTPMLEAYYERRGWPGGGLGADRRIRYDTIAAIM
jgi:aldehyde:ferredoxin oxidoreductase